MLQNKQTGFTIVELITATIVGSLLFLATATALAMITDVNQQSRNIALATTAAKNKVEDIRSQGFVSLTNGTTDFSGELTDSLTPPRNAKLTISDSQVGVKKLHIEIGYNHNGDQKILQFDSLISELGVGQY